MTAPDYRWTDGIFCSSNGRGEEIYAVLERPNWAPWLRFSAEQFEAQCEVFPEGQFLICDPNDVPLASLSTNRISWDGRLESLPTWNQVAGPTATYLDTYEPAGNAVVMMSANIRADARGVGGTERIFRAVRALAYSLGCDHVIVDARPNGFGEYKLTEGKYDFDAYCYQLREDGLPVDPWLRSFARNGIIPLRVDPTAMVVATSLIQFEKYRQEYRPGEWRCVEAMALCDSIAAVVDRSIGKIEEYWECQETGSWFVSRTGQRAVYVESNFWGRFEPRPDRYP